MIENYRWLYQNQLVWTNIQIHNFVVLIWVAYYWYETQEATDKSARLAIGYIAVPIIGLLASCDKIAWYSFHFLKGGNWN